MANQDCQTRIPALKSSNDVLSPRFGRGCSLTKMNIPIYFWSSGELGVSLLQEHVMRALGYSINVTLDGCCDHRAILADEDLHRHAVENLGQAECPPLWTGELRNDGGSVSASGGDGSEVRLDGTLRPDDRLGKEVRCLEHPRSGRLERGTRARGSGKGRSAARA